MPIKYRLITAFLATSSLMLLVGLASLYVYWQSVAGTSIKEAEYLAKTMAYSIWELQNVKGAETPLENDFQKYVEDLSKYQQRDIEIVDINKIIIADVVAEDIGKVLTADPNNEVGMTLKDGLTRTYFEISKEYPQGIKLVAVPLVNEQTGKIEGALIYEYTPLYNELVSSAKKGGTIIIVASSLCLLLSIALGWLMALHISKPIIKLKDAAAEIGEGRPCAAVEVKSQDEIGDLAAAFNRMVEALRVSALKYQMLFESSRDALMLLAPPSWKFTGANQATLQLFGASSVAEFTALGPWDVSPERQPDGRPSSEKAQEMIAIAMREGSHFFEWEHQRLDGQTFAADVLLTRMEENGESFLQATVRDITERKRAVDALRREQEEQKTLIMKLEQAQNHLLQSEKMASIGQLAAGVAHEINNPIGYVYSNLGTLEKYMQDVFGMLDLYEQAEGAITDPANHATLTAAKEKLDLAFLKEDLRALMDESKDGITRVKRIVQNMKDFSHVDILDEWHSTDLHKGLDSTLNIVANEIKYKADVVKEYGDLPEVECLSSQLNQVFMNLLVNAAHAIEERGTITIRTGQQGNEVWVEIADTGKGIKAEHLNKIFDPFFTTKPVGKGTGLGLSLSYSIIQKHHGRMEVQSEAGKGSTFRVWLPVKQLQDGQV